MIEDGIFAHQFEQDIHNVSDFFDVTSTQILNQQAETGATVTGTIIDLSKYSSNMLYIDSSSVTTVAAGMTGLEVSFYTRATSGSPFLQIALQSGVGAEAATLMKIEGTGGYTSGVVPIRDLKVLVKNVSSSATATIQAWVVSK